MGNTHKRRSRSRKSESIWDVLARVLAVTVVLVIAAGYVGNDAVRETLATPRQWGIVIAATIASVLAIRLVIRRTIVDSEVDDSTSGDADSDRRRGFLSTRLRTSGTDAGRSEATLATEPHEESAKTWAATDVLRRIEWRRFEALVEGYFKASGFPVRTQTHGADGGVDIWVCSKEQPDLPVAIVQCKHWPDKFVGVSVVRETLGAMTANKIRVGYVVASGAFSREAEVFANRGLSITLIDGQALVTRIQALPHEQQTELLAIAFEGEYWRPTCASCGVKMAWRDRGFWGCQNFPRCKNKAFPRAARASV